MLSPIVDIEHLAKNGWVRIAGAAPISLCQKAVSALESELSIPINDQTRWQEYGELDKIPMWGHQSLWDIRQYPTFYSIWVELWQRQDLLVTLDSCRFTPPWQAGYAEPEPIHFDINPWNERMTTLQGVIALTDTAKNQGGFRCVPSLLCDTTRWPNKATVNAYGKEQWLLTCSEAEILHVPASAGDLIVWNSRLPHSNSTNLSSLPRIAFYVAMLPADDKNLAAVFANSWSTGQCVPWWRDRSGFEHVEPWPPAQLTELGRHLVGADSWENIAYP